ncbi:MAG: sigma-70 family RNA polymerase sigma factor [Acidobacteria bacterium]|nr:sigma-70 family RNA polymerase sigma factor [Acidobacteriota bacterium]
MVQPDSATPRPSQTGEVTQLLLAWSNGDESALERLAPLVYAELHRLAHGYLRRERAGLGLQTTELIHEAWLRLVGGEVPHWRDRAHFFAVAARVMRHVLVELARARGYQKHGADAQRVTLDEAVRVEEERLTEVLAVHEALTLLAAGHPRVAEVVVLKYFGGMQGNEIAESLGVSAATVTEDLKFGKAWLRRALTGEKDAVPGAVATG